MRPITQVIAGYVLLVVLVALGYVAGDIFARFLANKYPSYKRGFVSFSQARREQEAV